MVLLTLKTKKSFKLKLGFVYNKTSNTSVNKINVTKTISREILLLNCSVFVIYCYSSLDILHFKEFESLIFGF